MSQTLQSHLDLVEQQFNKVAVIFASDDTASMAQASNALQALAVDLVQLIGPAERLRGAPLADIERIKALASGMSLLRDNLSRRAAYVHQALTIVVPTEPKSTYSNAGSPFGGVIQQSGQFKVLAA